MTYSSLLPCHWIAAAESRALMELLVGEFRPLQNHRCFLKIQARIAWVDLAWVSIAQIAEKIVMEFRVPGDGFPSITERSRIRRVQPERRASRLNGPAPN